MRIAVTTSQTTFNLQLGIVAQQQEVRLVDSDALSVATDSSANAGAVIIKGADLNALGDDAQDLQADLLARAGSTAGPNGEAIYIDGFSSGRCPRKSRFSRFESNQNPFVPEYDKLG